MIRIVELSTPFGCFHLHLGRSSCFFFVFFPHTPHISRHSHHSFLGGKTGVTREVASHVLLLFPLIVLIHIYHLIFPQRGYRKEARARPLARRSCILSSHSHILPYLPNILVSHHFVIDRTRLHFSSITPRHVTLSIYHHYLHKPLHNTHKYTSMCCSFMIMTDTTVR